MNPEWFPLFEETMKGYAGRGFNGQSYFTHNDDLTVWAIVGVSMILKERFAGMSLLVRLSNNYIIIEHDANDKILLDALLQAGIPRQSIILAYAGEPIPEAMDAIPESYLKIAFAS